jgi:hypothetical protein
MVHVAIFALCVASLVPSINRVPGPPTRPPRTPHEQRKIVDTHAEERRHEIERLLKIADETINRPGRRAEADIAIRLLGRMRAAEAVDFLIENLSFKGQADWMAVSGPASLEEGLPCVYALAEIGLPALQPLVRKAESTEADITHMHVAMTLRRSLGAEHATLYLRDHASKQPDKWKKKRIQSLIEWVAKAREWR